MDFSTVMIILACIIGLWIAGKIFSFPLKAIFKLIANSVLGGILIFIINLIGGAFSFHIGLNVGTSILVGILGIPRSHFAYDSQNFYILENNDCEWYNTRIHDYHRMKQEKRLSIQAFF